MGRTAIVTGGASGIGRALAAAMVGRGAHVVVADVDAEGAARVADRLNADGPGDASPATVDVRDAAAVRELVERTHRDRGLDVLCNNAGIGVGGDPLELTVAHWDRALDVNVRGVVHGCDAAWPLLLAQGHGRIVNTASLAGLVPSGQLAPYVMSKHAVVGLSLSLRAAAAGTGVRVHALCPGFVDTPILDSRGPTDLPVPASADALSLRELLGGFPYDADLLARDVLRGMARDDALIVAPRSARMLWRAQRFAPGLADRVSTILHTRVRSGLRPPTPGAASAAG
jgi:NAD(P)-dependent dehydrogenase (short-subunit alcohol dehydrogenase family)